MEQSKPKNMTDDRDISPPLVLVFDEHRPPYYVSSTLEDYLASVNYDEDVIFFDGGEAHTAYKRVDRKVKPVPAVFPEEVSFFESQHKAQPYCPPKKRRRKKKQE